MKAALKAWTSSSIHSSLNAAVTLKSIPPHLGTERHLEKILQQTRFPDRDLQAGCQRQSREDVFGDNGIHRGDYVAKGIGLGTPRERVTGYDYRGVLARGSRARAAAVVSKAVRAVSCRESEGLAGAPVAAAVMVGRDYLGCNLHCGLEARMCGSGDAFGAALRMLESCERFEEGLKERRYLYLLYHLSGLVGMMCETPDPRQLEIRCQTCLYERQLRSILRCMTSIYEGGSATNSVL